jgi:uncharacterized protein
LTPRGAAATLSGTINRPIPNGKERQMAGKFELYTDKAGEFRFRLKAGNGEIILASEGYKQKASATNGIESVKKNASDDARYERKETDAGNFRFNLKSTNGQVIGTSESYKSASGRDNGIESVKKNAPDARVEDLTV